MSQKKMKTMDGNNAAAYVSYAFTDVAAIYPITPSSVMAEVVDDWSAHGKKNIFGQEVKVVEMQSEGGASGTVHGSLAAGALTTTYTASQGLLLMVPNMYKIAGELLPAVFHVSARALAGHALSIFGDHSDVMATRQTGFAMLASCSVQEIMDLGSVAHLSAIKGSLPFLHFFDGFRTSHEVQKIETIDYDVYKELIDMAAVQKFRDNALSPEHPVTRGTAQNPDVFFQAKEVSNRFYDELPEVVVDYMNRLGDITGRKYKPFDYVGHPEAEEIIVAMGSVCETIEETINALSAEGRKVGLIKVRLYRPFVPKYFFDVLPKSVKKIAVLDRTKEPGAIGEPLYLDIRSIFFNMPGAPEIYGGRYGLGSKNTTPGQIVAVYDNLAQATPKDQFTIGIVDDVTNYSLPTVEGYSTEPEGTIRCKFWGLGSDGTVGANKSAIKIIGDNTDLYAQGYFHYDSKKSGGITISHLRFGKSKIQSTYLISQADFVACHNQAYVNQYDMLNGLKKGGTFLLNCIWSPEELEANLPASIKRYLAENDINFYIINATHIGGEIGLGNRINMIMQSAFFQLTKVIPMEDAVKYLKESIVDNYGFMGQNIVDMNNAAVDKGATEFVKIDVPASWATAEDANSSKAEVPEFIEKVLIPVSRQEGDKLPVSAFLGRENGTLPHGTAAYEKRGVAVMVPEWQIDNCIQCNQCSYVCPHATIRPILVTDGDKANIPAGFATKQAIGKDMEAYHYRIQVSPMDCMGCGVCADICPSKEKALIMKPIASQTAQISNWEYAAVKSKEKVDLPKNSVKGSQFATPYLEFSGACAGCGETPYIKLVTQLFGENMMIANATGCTSIWGASFPSAPYTTDANGRGPSWGNSLFEDNAEFGLGMAVATKQMRAKLVENAKALVSMDIPEALKSALNTWIETKDVLEDSRKATDALLPELKAASLSGDGQVLVNEMLSRKDYLAKRSMWMFGGDGWAYDIGYGGLDHVLASGENVNIMVLDTEVYSNTGGQSSKATPAAAIAMFAASGKKTKKKDLGLMAMGYGYVYVAQVSMGADRNQLMKAVLEAEAHDGPSLIIAYAPCVNHGIKKGMGKAQEVMKDAVKSGYWHLYRFNPSLKEEGKNGFILDSAAPSESFKDFLMGEIRYSQLASSFPDTADDLFSLAEENAKSRYETYRKLAESDTTIF